MSRFTSIVALVAFVSSSSVALADGITINGSGGISLCTPEMDKNKDGVCDWKDGLGTGNGGVVIGNPSGTSIEPDPLGMPGLVFMDTDNSGNIGLWTKVSWDERGARYAHLLSSMPTACGGVGLESVDIDGDGSLDVLVGDPENSTLAEGGGAVYVFLGSFEQLERPLDLRDADAIIYGSVAGGAFGAEIHAGETTRGQVAFQVNSAKSGSVWQFSIDNLPGTSDGGELVEAVGSWGWE